MARVPFPFLVALALTAAAIDSIPSSGGELSQTDVFISGKEGYHTFRIPSLIATPKGTLLAFCEGRKTSRADLGDNDLVLKRSTDGGRSWGKLQLVYEEGGDAVVTIGNPTAVVDRDTGVVWLAFSRNVRDVLVTSSSDDGKTWAKPRVVTQRVKDPAWRFYTIGPGVGIQLRHGKHKGRLLIPAYHRTTQNKSGASTSHVFYSDDHGRSWKLGGATSLHTNECQIVEVLAGEEGDKSRLLLNARNHWARSGGKPELAGVRLTAASDDGGETWSPATPHKTLIEPTCQASLLRYSWPGDGQKSRILFANPASRGRSRMTVRLSYDEGKTWPEEKLIYAGSSAYSCLAVLPAGRVGLIYERDDYGKLTFVAFQW